MSPLARRTLPAALATTALLAVIALFAGSVRLLPWVFDPDIPWRVMGPFARGLATIALEAACLVGWPLGWALACQRAVERGEWLALASLGERASVAVARLAPQAVVLAAMLATASLSWGRDASEPGRVASELIGEARLACAHVTAPRTYAVPFVDVTWLCSPSQAPHLVARAPGSLASTVVTATDADVAGDFRRIVLNDARTTVGDVHVHAAELVLRGLPPWSRAATLRPSSRAALLVVAALFASTASAYCTLGGALLFRARSRSRKRAATRLDALLIGVSGPLAVLGTLRALERSDASALLFLLAPLAGLLATVAVSGVLSRLPRRATAATT